MCVWGRESVREPFLLLLFLKCLTPQMILTPKWHILQWHVLLLFSWDWNTQAPILKDSDLGWESVHQNPLKDRGWGGVCV